MKKVTNELVQIFWEDDEMVAMLHQNGEIKLYRLKKGTKQDVQDLLEIPQITKAS